MARAPRSTRCTRAPDIACVASKVLDWEGETVDFVDAALSFYGQGFKLHVGEPADERYDEAHDVLFATGAAMVVRDRRVPLGGRLRRALLHVLRGRRPRLAAVAARLAGALRAALAGLPSAPRVDGQVRELARAVPARTQRALHDLQELRRPQPRPGPARGARACRCDAASRSAASTPTRSTSSAASAAKTTTRSAVPKSTLASMYAVDAFVENIRSLRESRDDIQRRRQRGDHEILEVVPPAAAPQHRRAVLHDRLRRRRGGHERRAASSRRGARSRSPPATRSPRGWPARRSAPGRSPCALCREHDVKLVSTVKAELTHPDFDVYVIDPASMAELEAWCDVIVFQGYILHEYPVIRDSKKIIVADIYDPFHLEQLEQARDLGEKLRKDTVLGASYVLNQQLTRGDFFLCASDKQRDFWLGQLAAVGRINPANYDASPSLSKLIQLVPFGVSDDPPRQLRPAIKGVVPGIGRRRQGHPVGRRHLQLVRPADAASARSTSCGCAGRTCACSSSACSTRTPTCPRCAWSSRRARLADELGLTDRHVFFNEQWVAYDDRQNYLLDADIGVSHALPPRRDRVLLPHPHPRLPVGGPAVRHDRGRLVRATSPRARRSA